MIRVRLDEAQRAALRRMGAASGRVRERLAMVELSDTGWSPPRIAAHVGRDVDVVRMWLQRFQAAGVDGLADAPRCGGPRVASAVDIAALVAAIRAGGRTWTAADGAAWLAAERGVRLGRDQVGHRLREQGLRWRRTRGSVAHRQDAAARERAAAEIAALEKGRRRAL